MAISWQSYGASPTIWDYTCSVNPPFDTGERAASTPAKQANTQFTYHGGMEG